MSYRSVPPLLAVTMGDPAGIGPEIAVKAFSAGEPDLASRLLLVGNSGIMREAIQLTGSDLCIREIRSAGEASFEKGVMNVLNLPVANREEIRTGEISAQAGDIAFRCIVKAIQLAMEGEVDGVVTNPIHKKAIHDAGHPFAGHTEIFAHYTGSSGYAMLLADDKLRVVHVSTHVPLRKACDLVKRERILETIFILNDGLKNLGIPKPRIGVAGLNPHAGDEGLFGDEEIREIRPAIDQAVQLGMDVTGPVPPDTLFALAAGGKFDGCVAMYHDQGHIPFKMSGFEWDVHKDSMKRVSGVNITLGLPVIRTSVDHGTAFEIAGKGIASPRALIQAIEYAIRLVQNKKK